ncbi:MAG: HD family phosphohydrolase, partial [Bacteroidia bacterium]|nr:HD family phosphohydrolase [Bacteroidia bacterium]
HDTGYITGQTNHEAQSVQLMKDFFTKENITEYDFDELSQLILATKMPQAPSGLLQEIICDADMSHAGGKDFFELVQLLRSEWEMLDDKKFSNAEWYKLNVGFLENHTYFNHYSSILFEERKNSNLAKLKKMMLKAEVSDVVTDNNTGNSESSIKEMKLGRGIETMFRITLKNHMTLSAIADNKANIMLSINAIIISITVSTLVPMFDSNPQFILPTVGLLVVCLTAIIFATLSTRPKITSGTFTKTDIKERKANLLFFGNFHGVGLDDFEFGMTELIKDPDYLYTSMSRDLFFLGKVLARKYSHLRTCYNIFMFGIVFVVILFGISFFL